MRSTLRMVCSRRWSCARGTSGAPLHTQRRRPAGDLEAGVTFNQQDLHEDLVRELYDGFASRVAQPVARSRSDALTAGNRWKPPCVGAYSGAVRSPGRRNPRKDQRLVPGSEIDLGALSDRVTYVISTEHKDYLTSAGPGRLRSDSLSSWTQFCQSGEVAEEFGCEWRCQCRPRGRVSSLRLGADRWSRLRGTVEQLRPRAVQGVSDS